jgi:hypothetical protein
VPGWQGGADSIVILTLVVIPTGIGIPSEGAGFVVVHSRVYAEADLPQRTIPPSPE